MVKRAAVIASFVGAAAGIAVSEHSGLSDSTAKYHAGGGALSYVADFINPAALLNGKPKQLQEVSFYPAFGVTAYPAIPVSFGVSEELYRELPEQQPGINSRESNVKLLWDALVGLFGAAAAGSLYSGFSEPLGRRFKKKEDKFAHLKTRRV